jgi:ribosome-associated protein
MDSRKMALLCRELADNKKAEDIVILDVRDVSSVTDYFVIASGTSEPHLRAIVDEIRDRLRDDYELRPKAVDGTLQTAWIVLDFFDVIVHVMRTDVRERYDLETLWGDAPRVKTRKKSVKAVAGNGQKPAVSPSLRRN